MNTQKQNPPPLRGSTVEIHPIPDTGSTFELYRVGEVLYASTTINGTDYEWSDLVKRQQGIKFAGIAFKRAYDEEVELVIRET